MNPQKLKKLEKLAKVLDGGDVELLTLLDNLEEKTEKEIQAIEQKVMEAISVAEQTKKLQGEQGEKGEDGIDGKDGLNGLDGKNGTQGVPGKDGLDGKDGVDGKDGEQGDKGDKGDPGKDGADGFIDDATVGYLEEELKRIDKKNGGYGQVVRKLRAGNNISIDETNMEYPVISVDPQITVSDTAPTAPATNDIWIDTNAYTYRAVTGTYTIVATDYLIDCSGTFTVTLPTAVGFTGEYIIKNSSNGIITLNTTSSQTIDSLAFVLVNQYDSIVVRSNSTDWIIV